MTSFHRITTGRPRGLVHGWGINDAQYPITKVVSGKQIKCPYYHRWESMLRRVKADSSYGKVVVSPEWKHFSNFRSWMETQNWESRELDKDLLSNGNKVYSPDTCVFVPSYVNKVVVTNATGSNNLPLGVIDASQGNEEVYMVSLSGQFTPERYSYGYYTTQNECHQAWQIAKASQIKQAVIAYISEGSFDSRVVTTLHEIAERIQTDYSNYVETTRIL